MSATGNAQTEKAQYLKRWNDANDEGLRFQNLEYIGNFKGMPVLVAQKAGVTIALLCSHPIKTASVGYAGISDGWLDLAVDVGGKSVGRIQTFVPPDRPLAPGTFDLGIGLQRDMRGQGYGREAVTLLTDWLFEHAGAQLVEAGTDPANHAMRAVFRHVGWQEDGTLTEVGRDWLMYRITRQQWQAAGA